MTPLHFFYLSLCFFVPGVFFFFFFFLKKSHKAISTCHYCLNYGKVWKKFYEIIILFINLTNPPPPPPLPQILCLPVSVLIIHWHCFQVSYARSYQPSPPPPPPLPSRVTLICKHRSELHSMFQTFHPRIIVNVCERTKKLQLQYLAKLDKEH